MEYSMIWLQKLYSVEYDTFQCVKGSDAMIQKISLLISPVHISSQMIEFSTGVLRDMLGIKPIF